MTESSPGSFEKTNLSLDEIQQRLADVAIRVGVNLDKDQKLVIRAGLEHAPFVRHLARAAYRAGAGYVLTDWRDPHLTRIRLTEGPDSALEWFPPWPVKKYLDLADENAAFLTIAGDDPDALRGVPAERRAKAQRTAAKAFRPYTELTMSFRAVWSIVPAAMPAWAKKLYPDVPEAEAMTRLWHAIARTMRLDSADPVAAWRSHVDRLGRLAEWLNGLKLRRLHYRAPGTDLHVGLPEGHIWMAGGDSRPQGGTMVVNLPTEEVFTLPHRDEVDGTLQSTMPLNYGGVVISGMRFRFEGGRIVDFDADEGRDTLKQIIGTDEGSRRLGEAALVPVDSPISRMGTIFYNTLFDENASCHFAIGRAYPFTLQGGVGQTQEELGQRGANDSLIHVDFMVGSAEMDIDGETADGRTLPIFRQGNWAAGVGE